MSLNVDDNMPQYPASYVRQLTDETKRHAERADALQAKLDRVEKLVERWRRFSAQPPRGSGRATLAAAVRDLDRALDGETGA